MKITVVQNYAELSAGAAEYIAAVVADRPNATLGLATGNSPLGCYKLLCEYCARGDISFAHVTTLNLDEYVGLTADNADSYAYFMRKNLFDNIDIDPRNTHIPNGVAPSLQQECARYARLVGALPRAVQLLGIGVNGHIGFNEPGTPLNSVTHAVQLSYDTICANAAHFGGSATRVPTRAITMGIGEIMSAERILLIASGSAKAQAVKDAVRGDISPLCPASVLQTHADCTFIVDEQAASLL